MPGTGLQPCDEGVILSSPVTAPCSAAAAPWILAATILASSLAFIDGSVVNLALPSFQVELNATVIDAQWVIEAYSLLLAALILVGGSLGDIYGRRRVFATGVVLFAASSIWCGLAPNIGQLILARALQGIGAALLVPGSLAIISASFQKQDRGRAIGTWSGFTSITAAVGPVLGGFLIEHGSWRWVFFINVPLALIVLALTFWRVPESRNPEAARTVDWIGAILATAGLAGVVYALIESPQRGWNDAIVAGTFVSGVLALVAFVVIEASNPNPLLPLTLFRSRDFTGANLLTLFLYSALTGLFFFLPLNLIQVQRYSPTAAGASMLPFILLMFLLSRWSGGLVDRYGAKRPLVLGPILVALGFLIFMIPSMDGSYWTTYFPAVLVLGFGMAVTVAPLTTAVMNSVPAKRAGTASGINNAVSRLAGVLSIAVLGIVMLTTFDRQLSSRMAGLDLSPQIRQQIESERVKLAAIEIPQELDSRLREEIRRSVDGSFVAGFRVVMFVAACLAVLSSITAKLLIEDKPKG
jgi:EmrB/QacA subfamily drug resistance transporter